MCIFRMPDVEEAKEQVPLAGNRLVKKSVPINELGQNVRLRLPVIGRFGLPSFEQFRVVTHLAGRESKR